MSARLGSRRLFPDLLPSVYLNHAAMSAPSEPVRLAVDRVLQSYAREGVGAVERWVENREVLRGRLARLISTRPEHIALVSNTTHGIVAVAQSLRWSKGDRVLVFSGEFPTNITPWQQAANTYSLDCVQLPLPVDQDGHPSLSACRRELERGVRLVAISAVQFQTGWAMPLSELGALCRDYGALLFVDGIQAVGAMPIDVSRLPIDYLAAGGHKWLMGIEGAGFLYASPKGFAALEPRLAGWMSHEGAFDMLVNGPGHLRYDRPIRARIDHLESGVTHSAGFAALEASTALIELLGVTSIWEHINNWNAALHEGLRSRNIVTCRQASSATHSGILSVSQDALHDRFGGRTVAEIAAALGSHSIAVSTPDGHLRFAPHWPNALDEVSTVLRTLDTLLL